VTPSSYCAKFYHTDRKTCIEYVFNNIIRRHCLHTALEMRPTATYVARSVVCVCLCVCVCVLDTRVSCAKATEPIMMPVWGLTFVNPRNRVLDEVKIGRIHSQPRGVTTWRCGLLQNYFGNLLFYILRFFLCVMSTDCL